MKVIYPMDNLLLEAAIGPSDRDESRSDANVVVVDYRFPEQRSIERGGVVGEIVEKESGTRIRFRTIHQRVPDASDGLHTITHNRFIWETDKAENVPINIGNLSWVTDEHGNKHMDIGRGKGELSHGNSTSRKHGRLTVEKGGKVTYTDLGSSNGTEAIKERERLRRLVPEVPEEITTKTHLVIPIHAVKEAPEKSIYLAIEVTPRRVVESMDIQERIREAESALSDKLRSEGMVPKDDLKRYFRLVLKVVPEESGPLYRGAYGELERILDQREEHHYEELQVGSDGGYEKVRKMSTGPKYSKAITPDQLWDEIKVFGNKGRGSELLESYRAGKIKKDEWEKRSKELREVEGVLMGLGHRLDVLIKGM